MVRVAFVLSLAVACASRTTPPPADVDDLDEPTWARSGGDDEPAARTPRSAKAAPAVTSRRSVVREPRRGPRVDMNFRNADLAEVFRMLATVGGMNIVLAPSVSGTVTLRLKGVEWNLALDTICRAHGLEILRNGNVLLIRPRRPNQ